MLCEPIFDSAAWFRECLDRDDVPVGRLWSLLDMIRFNARQMADMRTVVSRLDELAGTDVANWKAYAGWVEQLHENLAGLGLELTEKTLVKTLKVLKRGKEIWPGELHGLVTEFNGRFRDELDSRVVFALPPGAQAYFDPAAPLFGQDVHDAFPSSRFEVSEAGKCFALGRFTACVMHLMRALEMPLTLQAKDLGFTPKRDSWGPILQEIDDAIGALKTADPKKEFHSGAATQFTFIKNAWRDAAMHQRGKYEEDDAAPIMAATKGLMRHLAKQLKE